VTGLLCKNVLIYLNLFNFSPLLPKSPVLSRDVSFSSPAEAIGRTGRRNRRFVLVDDWRIGARVEARKVGGVRAALFKGWRRDYDRKGKEHRRTVSQGFLISTSRVLDINR
jgi:hypothetical protein